MPNPAPTSRIVVPIVSLKRLAAFQNPEFYKNFYAAAALPECVPAWIRFLQLRELVDADGLQRTLHELQPLATNVLRAFEKVRSDAGLCEAIRQCPEWRAD
jgi:hypothetical protein